MPLSVSAARRRIAEVLVAAQWRESVFPADLLGLVVGEGLVDLHKCFGVVAPDTTFGSPLESQPRKRGDAGGLVESTFIIRWLYRVRADNAIADYDDALDEEEALVVALCAASRSDGLHLSVGKMVRRTVAGGTFLLGEVTVSAGHHFRIQAPAA